MKIALILNIFLLLSCQEQAKSQMKESKKTISQISISTGNPEFRGQYTLLLSPDISQITFSQGEEKLTFSTESSDVFDKVVDKIKVSDPTELKTTVTQATPGDEEIKFQISEDNNERTSALWLNEQWTNKELKSWFEFYKSLIVEISDGKLSYQ